MGGWLSSAAKKLGKGISDAGSRLDDAVRQTGSALDDIVRGEDKWDELANGMWETFTPGGAELGNELMRWLLPDQPGAAAAINGTQLNRDGKIQYIPVVYGQCRVGGARVLQAVSGANNEFLHIVLVLNDGRIEAIDNIYVDDKLITDASIASLVRAKTYLGDDNQTADADLIADLPAMWTTAHRLRGVAYVYLRLQWSQGVFSGNPRINCDVRGRRVYDPRTATTAYSNNAALCIRDYLTNSRYGRGVAATALNEQSWIDAADYCDTSRTPYAGAPVQKLWTCDGVVDTSNRVLDNVRQLASCCAGAVVYTSGRWAMSMLRESASVLTLTEQHIIGGIKYGDKGKAERLNSIRATWANPAIDDKADELVLSDATYLAADNSLTLERSLSLPYTRNVYRAQDLCEIALRQSRLGLGISFRATLAALPLSPGDVFGLTYASLGWYGKLWRVVTAKLQRDATIAITAVEYSAAVYSFAARSQITFAPPTSLPDASVCPPPTALQLASGTSHLLRLGDGTIMSRIYASWTAPAGYPFISGYEVEMKLSSSLTWLPVAVLAGIASTGCYVPQVQDGSAYDVRVRAVTGSGVTSPWATATNHTVTGKTSAPSAASALVTASTASGVSISWANPTDADLDHVRVFAAASNDRTLAVEVGRTYGNEMAHPLPSGSINYYWVRAYDTSGNASAWYPSGATSGVAGYSGSVLTQSGDVDPSAVLLGAPSIEARSVYVQREFTGTADLAVTTVGSGASVTEYKGYRVRLDVNGATTAAVESKIIYAPELWGNGKSWGDGYQAKYRINMPTGWWDDKAVAYVGRGDISAVNGDFIGFKIIGGKLYGATRKGGIESLTAIYVTLNGTGEDMYLSVALSGGVATFGMGDIFLSYTGTISSNIPTSALHASKAFTAIVYSTGAITTGSSRIDICAMRAIFP